MSWSRRNRRLISGQCTSKATTIRTPRASESKRELGLGAPYARPVTHAMCGLDIARQALAPNSVDFTSSSLSPTNRFWDHSHFFKPSGRVGPRSGLRALLLLTRQPQPPPLVPDQPSCFNIADIESRLPLRLAHLLGRSGADTGGPPLPSLPSQARPANHLLRPASFQNRVAVPSFAFANPAGQGNRPFPDRALRGIRRSRP